MATPLDFRGSQIEQMSEWVILALTARGVPSAWRPFS